MSRTIVTLTTASALGAGISGGVFLAFSTFVMKAVDGLSASQSIKAMQGINKYAPNPLFMLALFGTALACLALGASALFRWSDPNAKVQLVASVIYVLGILVTVGYHIPHNNSLDLVDPSRADAAHVWSSFSTGWTAWNHVRTFTSIATAVLLTISLRIG